MKTEKPEFFTTSNVPGQTAGLCHVPGARDQKHVPNVFAYENALETAKRIVANPAAMQPRVYVMGVVAIVEREVPPVKITTFDEKS